VFERITAHLDNDGSVRKAREFTRVSVEGNGPGGRATAFT
jgi:hypothetical protein